MNSSISSNASIAATIHEGAQALHRAGIPEARREASSLLEFVVGRDRTFMITHAEAAVSVEQLDIFRLYVDRRASGEPLQYITGRQAFFGLDFEVTPDVLIPRPETELLVEAALKLIAPTANPLICDVGTGSGCIAITVLHQNTSASAIGIDLSERAAQVARRNARRHSVMDRLSLLVADCFDASSNSTKFDLIISNPPYVSASAMAGLQREVRDHEPRVALTAGPDGLSIIRRLLNESGHFLKTGGHLLFEIGFDQGEAVDRLVSRDEWQLIEIQRDLQGIPRIVALRKIAS